MNSLRPAVRKKARPRDAHMVFPFIQDSDLAGTNIKCNERFSSYGGVQLTKHEINEIEIAGEILNWCKGELEWRFVRR